MQLRHALFYALVLVAGGCGSEEVARQAESAPASPDATCSHGPCTAGSRLASSCSSCVASVCKQDSYCCNTGWDKQCVSEASSICGCGAGGGGSGGQGGQGGQGGSSGGGSGGQGGQGGSSGGGGSGGGSDGPPTRQQCTGNFGSGLSGSHGRLDGYLVSIVPPGHSGCNGDSTHVHLQVLMNNAIYDVAVNVDGGYYLAKDITMPDGSWSEGWHTNDSLSYTSLGLSSGSFDTMSQSAMASTVENELAQANHISVFGTGYNSHGMHLIHYEGSGKDGAIVINPQAASSRLLFFHFSNQSF